MNADQLRQETEKQEKRIAAAPNWSDPFWQKTMVPYLIARQTDILSKLMKAGPEEYQRLQGQAQAITDLLNEQVRQELYERMVAAELEKWRAAEEKRNGPGRNTGDASTTAGWAARAAGRLARRKLRNPDSV